MGHFKIEFDEGISTPTVSFRGICRLSIVPVRSSDSDKSEMVTQLLFGDHYSVLEESENGKWLKIKIYYDDYEGWIDKKQHSFISEPFFYQINNLDYKICTDVTAKILFKKQVIHVVLGSILPMASNELFRMEDELQYSGGSKSIWEKRDYKFLKEVALQYLNTPYLWGGKSPFGIDCSGFSQKVFKICGYKLPRDAYQQALVGKIVPDIEDAAPGDLAFFTNTQGRVYHVGIILEDGNIIHASGKVKIEKIDENGIFDKENNVYSHPLSSLRRILKS
ncbi:MAG: C40 family peptidase [Bacteroidota bacterium]|nr:C40 family peptidase [Bacteroidota bacterium]